MVDEGRRTKDEGRKTKGRLVFRPSSFVFTANILLIFALGLAIRVAYWQDARAYALGADEPDYVIPAQTFARDGRYVDTYISNDRIWTRVPLTALFFAGSFLFAPDSAAAGAQGDDAALMEPRYDALNIAQIFISLITVALTMLLAARSFPTEGTGCRACGRLHIRYISTAGQQPRSARLKRAAFDNAYFRRPLRVILVEAARLVGRHAGRGRSHRCAARRSLAGARRRYRHAPFRLPLVPYSLYR